MRQTVVEAIRQALLNGRFEQGQSLSEVALAAEMNVSRGPVREALLVLAQEGLVTHSQNYGFSVLRLTEQDREEIRQVRFPLEVLALKLARERMGPAALAALEEGIGAICRPFAAGRLADCVMADMNFHARIWDASGNARLAQSLRTLMVPFFAYGSVYKMSRPDLTEQLLEEQHRQYLDFLRGDGVRTAEECVLFHLGGS
jgi:DNA-binding GntR family transcriptional regulator